MAFYVDPYSGGNGVPLTVAQASDPSNNVEGTVSGAVLAAAIAALAPKNYTEFFTPTDGQTVFTLKHKPTDATSVKFFVNGDENSAPNITVGGFNVTWVNTAYALGSGDTIVISYN